MASYSEMLLGGAPAAPQQAPPPQKRYSDVLLGSAPSEAPEPITPRSDYARSASMSDIAVASLADDPQARLRYYAKQRKLPVDRYRVVGDRVAYEADDGQWYLERPNATMDPRTWLPSAAGGVGPSMPIVAGAAAGVASAPMLLAGPAGMAGSIGLTGAAAAGGQAGREALAEQILGQEMSPGRIAYEGAAAGLGQGIGGGMTSYAQRHAVKDIARLDRPAARALTEKAADRGIHLTPAESTGLPSLAARQKALGNLTDSADEMAGFYRGRAEDIAGAVGRELDAISPVDSAEIGGQMARAAGVRAMDDVAANRAAQASPLYQKAFSEAGEVDVAPVLGYARNTSKLFPKDGQVARTLDRVRNLLTQEMDTPQGKVRVAEKGLERLHNAKLEIDNLLEGQGENSLGRVTKQKLVEVKKRLLDEMDRASPTYGNARAIYADLSPGVQKIREGVVGVIADLPDTQLQTVASRLFSPSRVGPKAVIEARHFLKKASPDAWQAIKRAFIEEHWLKAGKETVAGGPRVNQGAMFRKTLFGDPKQKEILRHALEPKEWKALNELAEILEATGRVKPIGSDTAWNQEMVKVMSRESTPAWIRGMRYLSVDAFKEASARLSDWSMAKNAAEMARIITSPGGIEKLKQLRQLDTPAAIRRALVGHLFAQSGTAAAESALSVDSGVAEPKQ